MEYRKFGANYYVRMDKGDEVVSSIMAVCEREDVRSVTFSGIGGCSDAVIQVFDPDRGAFDDECAHGVLELVSLTGNVIWRADGTRASHAHALFAYRGADGGQRMLAGHLKSTTVLYTAEIEIRPVEGGVISAALNPETNTDFWAFP